MQQKQQRIQQSWILRVHTENSRLRLELSPWNHYQKVLDLICQKLECQQRDIEVYSPNGRRLNIATDRRIRDVVYLSHGAIIQVRLTNQAKSSALRQRASFLSADSKISLHTRVTPPKPKCTHPDNVRCLHCETNTKGDPFAGSGQRIYDMKESEFSEVRCSHGPKSKCMRCQGKGVRSADKANEISKVRSPGKNNPELEDGPCRHRSTVTCKKCVDKPAKFKSIALLKEETPIMKKLLIEDKQQEVKEEKIENKCNHGENAKCINCNPAEKIKNDDKNEKKLCQHGPNGKCFHCVPSKQKPAHMPFDEYLLSKKVNCAHPPSKQCLNCLPQVNLRLTVDKKCKKHPPYPDALCSACRPQNVSIKAQAFRHVDYVQFMNNQQVHNFIDYWLGEKKEVMRVGFLYGYFAEDPYYKNGIRAIVEAIYEPHQYCTFNQFWIMDSQQRRENIDIVAQSAGLQNIGMILASPNTADTPFTQGQIRVMAKLQSMHSVTHSTGYKLSNFFTVLVRKNKDPKQPIQPAVFMASDQAQALEEARMFVPHKKSTFKMELRDYDFKDELRPVVYLGGKEATEVEIEYLLVKIAAGVGKNKKFSIMKNNLFPPSSRGAIKTQQLKDYINRTKNQPSTFRYGDLNLLLFIAEAIDLGTAMEIGNRVHDEKEVDSSTCQLVQATLKNFIS